MYQIGRKINQIQYAIDRVIPVLYQELFVLNWFEVHGVVNTVNSTSDDSLVIQCADLLLTVTFLDLDQLAESGKSEFSVIFADYSDVVLNQHALQLVQMSLYIKINTLEKWKDCLNSSKLSGLYSSTLQLTISSERNCLIICNNSGYLSS